MKKRSFLFGALAALAMMGCSDNELNQVDNSPVLGDGSKTYMKVTISSPTTGSRALGDTENGTQDEGDVIGESSISNILFVFYNSNGNKVGETLMKKVNKPNDQLGDDEFKGETGNGSGNFETELTIIVPVKNVVAGGSQPYYVMAYVNPYDTGDQGTQQSLSDIFRLTRKDNKVDTESDNDNQYMSNGYFVMNNSVYYPNTNSAEPVNAVVINGLHQTKADAEKEGAAATNIYVERICAKVRVTNEGENSVSLPIEGNGVQIDGEVVSGHTITFHPQGWALNGTAKESYLVKQFRAGHEETDQNVSYNSVNARFGTTFKSLWSPVGDNVFRNYWCTSYNYGVSNDQYPSVASQAASAPLNYFSYNYVSANANKWGDVAYCLEHNVTDVNTRMSGYTSVIVFGYYTLDDATAGTDFYTYGENNGLPIVYTDVAALKTAMLGTATASVLYTRSGAGTEGDPYKYTKVNDATVYDVVHPADNVKGSRLIPSRYVYLQLSENLAADTYYYQNENQEYKPVATPADKLAVNQQLFAVSDHPATKFDGGKVYYNIPIEQFGKVDGEAVYGTYGVVRNHYYNINILGISGLGTAIGQPEDPIVPPTETQTYYVRTNLNILPWKLVTQPDVILGQ